MVSPDWFIEKKGGPPNDHQANGIFIMNFR